MKDFWGKMSRRERGILAAAALLLGLFLGQRLVFSSGIGAWQDLDDQISAREARWIHGQALLARKDALMKESRARVPAPAGVDEKTGLLRVIEAAARSAGVKVVDVQQRGGKDGGVSVTTESGWGPLAGFFQALDRSPRPLRVERAAIRARSDGSPVLNAQLLVRFSDSSDAK